MSGAWQRFQQYLCLCPELDLSVDVSRMSFDDAYFDRMEPAMDAAFAAMDALEQGAIANPDENRMVGHYWLRAPQLAPTPEIRGEIETTLAAIRKFAAAVHAGTIKSPSGEKFSHVLSIGIGGSALGPEFVHDALGEGSKDRLQARFIDNTD